MNKGGGEGAMGGPGGAATGANAGAAVFGTGAADAMRFAAEADVIAGSPAAPAMMATTAPTAATSPAPTRISVRTPVEVAGTSIDTLSVSISNRLSPGLTASPIDLNQVVILPSATVSPSCGIRMSIQVSRC